MFSSLVKSTPGMALGQALREAASRNNRFNHHEKPNVICVPPHESDEELFNFLNGLEIAYKQGNKSLLLSENFEAKVNDFVRKHKLNEPKAAAWFCERHPKTCLKILYYLVLAVASGALLTQAVAAFGFTIGGVAAGSFAAAWHSAIGDVAAGSMFAKFQSIAATGEFKKVGYLIGTIAAIIGIISLL